MNAEQKGSLSNFRVAELQVLLGTFGRSKVGRKQELLCRCQDLYKDPKLVARINEKIKDLEKSRYRQRTHPYAPQQPMPPRTYSFPVNPDVKLTSLPFHEKWMTLVRPTMMNCSTIQAYSTNRTHETFISFTLSPEVAETIKASRIKQFGSKQLFKMQIMLRICPLELSCPQSDQYPPNCHVLVNGASVGLPGFQPARTPGEQRKCGQPIDITPYCQLSSSSANCVSATAAPSFNGQRFIMAVQICRNRTASDLLHIVQGTVRNSDHSRALIKEKLSSDPESEVATTSLRISLLCPLGKTRLLHPGRATTCNHLQCFDIATFLQMNERKARWVCPVCDRPAAFEHLFIDGFLLEILDRALSGVEHIELLEDGSWKPLHSNKTAVQSTPPSLISSPPTAEMPSSSTTALPSPPPLPPPASAPTMASRHLQAFVIDLTEDSEDDECPPPVSSLPPPIPLPSSRNTSPPNIGIPGLVYDQCVLDSSGTYFSPSWELSSLSFTELSRLFNVPPPTPALEPAYPRHDDALQQTIGHSSAYPISLDD